MKYPKILSVAFLFLFLSSLGFGQDNKTPEVKLSGNLSIITQFYNANGIPDRRDPFTWQIVGSPRLSIGKFNIPIRLLTGNYENKFRQQFNRFGLSPEIEWAKFHIGHHSPDYSRIVVGGQPFLGAGFEINPSLLRLGFSYGRLQRAIEPDSTSTELFRPSFSRTGYTMKIGVGKKNNYIDFIFLKASDRVESIAYIPEDEGILPESNTAFGITTSQRIAKKVFFKFDFGLSAYTRDTRSTELEDPDFGAHVLLKPFFTPLTSTQFVKAFKGSLEYRDRKVALGVGYDRVDPDYQTMATYYFRDDVERAYIFTKFKLAKNKVTLNTRLGGERNNLYSLKLTQNIRWIGNINLLFRPTRTSSINLFYTNHQLNVVKDREYLNDSTEIKQVLNNIGGNVFYLSPGKTIKHQTNVGASYQISDQSINLGEDQQVTSINLNASYIVKLVSANFSFGPRLNYNNSKFPGITVARLSPEFEITKGFGDNKVFMSAFFSTTILNQNSSLSANIMRPRFQFRWKAHRHFSLAMNLLYFNYNSKVIERPSFNELQGTVKGTVRF
ncbi:MAG: hypothetical protein AAF502_08935 [Bacteroidota bacterium]